MEQKRTSIPGGAGMYVFVVLMSGFRAGIYRLLFNFYVTDLGYTDGLINTLIAVSVLTSVTTLLPLSYLADWVGKKYAMLISIAGTIFSLLMMVILPSRMMFFVMNIMLGLSQALTQVSMGPAETRFMPIINRAFYYSIPAAVSTFSNYAVSIFPVENDFEFLLEGHDGILYLGGFAIVLVIVVTDMWLSSHLKNQENLHILTVGGVEIPVGLVLKHEEDPEEFIKPVPSVAQQVNFILQGMLQRDGYQGTPFEISENSTGDLMITIEGQGEYIGVSQVPDDEIKTLIQRASNLWVEQNLKK